MLQKVLWLSTKFEHQKTRWNYGILRSEKDTRVGLYMGGHIDRVLRYLALDDRKPRQKLFLTQQLKVVGINRTEFGSPQFYLHFNNLYIFA